MGDGACNVRGVSDPAAFVRENTVLRAPPLVPELHLHLADEALPLWHRSEQELGETGLPPPFWAFAWAGGQALARHLIDHRALVAGRSVLDLGAGGGAVAIAAARAGAVRVSANDVDPFARAAIALNAAANGVDVTIVADDLLDGATDAAVVLAADLFYERELAERVFAFLRRAAESGADVLIGDPRRSYLPVEALEVVATYAVPVTRALEDADIKRTSVWRFAPRAAAD